MEEGGGGTVIPLAVFTVGSLYGCLMPWVYGVRGLRPVVVPTDAYLSKSTSSLDIKVSIVRRIGAPGHLSDNVCVDVYMLKGKGV